MAFVGLLFLGLLTWLAWRPSRRRLVKVLAHPRFYVYRRMISVLTPLVFPVHEPRILLMHVTLLAISLLSRLLETCLVPLQLGRVVDSLAAASKGSKSSFLGRELTTYMLLRLVNSQVGLLWLQSSLASSIDVQDNIRIKTTIFRKLLLLSSDFWDGTSPEEVNPLVTRIIRLVRMNHEIIKSVIPGLFALLFAVLESASLFGVGFAAVFAVVMTLQLTFETWYFGKEVTFFEKTVQYLEKDYIVRTSAFQHWSTVFYFGRARYEQQRYESIVAEHQQAEALQQRHKDLLHALRDAVTLSSLAIISVMTIRQIRYHGRSPGDFVMVMSYWMQLNSLAEIFYSTDYRFRSEKEQISRTVEILSMEPTVQDKPGAPDLVLTQGRIDFENVSFDYDGRRPIIRDVSFSICGGETVALVGETGGGKSTLLKLLCRRYDVTSGSIRIDGQDVRDVRHASLMEHFGVVPQETGLFRESVRYNVAYGRPDASQEEIEGACRGAVIHNKILGFTEGYDTAVGGGSSARLSGGEMQRLAIARVLVKKDARIVLMDEAMSSLDSETDWAIQRNLRRWARGRTLIMVAHRLSTIAHADLILVVKGGEIVEAGKQRDLLDRKGHYYQMWVKQNEGLDDGNEILGQEALNTKE